MHSISRLTIGLFSIWCTLASVTLAKSWPSFRHDFARSGIADGLLDASRLELDWQWKSESPPDPAWDGPARWDAYNLIRDLPAMRQYDACFHPVSDGQTLYVGSSSQDSLTALDLKTGRINWTFVAGGPIRLAPTIDGSRILFGCDDGNVYCLNRREGDLAWRFNPSLSQRAPQRRLLNNDRLISCYPIRTGVVIRDGLAYFAASFLPWRESYVCAVDAKTGQLTPNDNTFVVRHDNATLEGNLLVANDRLIVPQGRVAPLMFDRNNGNSLGSLPGGGGVTLVLTESGDLLRAEGGREARPGQVGIFRGKERIASFPRGRAMVVSDDSFYVIDGQKLFSAERNTNELNWAREIAGPLEIIRCDDILLIGGQDHVTAVDADSGDLVWSAEIEGRAFGLAVAGNRLVASTDTGRLYVFSPTAEQAFSSADSKNLDGWDAPTVPPMRSENLLHRWVFHRTAMRNRQGKPPESTSLAGILVKEQASSLDLRLKGTGQIVRIGDSQRVEALEFKQSYFPVADQFTGGFPGEAVSLEAWVRVDEPTHWGGIIGCIQDDGATEHGCLLGYRADRFCMAVAGGGNGLTYLTAEEKFEKQSWNHVVGTYDGRQIRLYVNGRLVAAGEQEQGPISYSDQCHVTVGAYRDADELFPLTGAVQEICVYSDAMDPIWIRNRYLEKADEFPKTERAVLARQLTTATSFLAWGPVARYVSPGVVKISYGTVEPCPTVVDLTDQDEISQHSESTVTQQHEIEIGDLPYRRQLQFRIRDDVAQSSNVTPAYALDTHFNWTLPKSEEPSEPIQRLIAQIPNPRGLALLIGGGQQEMAERLARESDLVVILQVDDQATATTIREDWQADPKLVYGRDLCVTTTALADIPAASAALVIADGDRDTLRRLVRPEGGVLSDGRSVVWARKPVAGSGIWSHMYGSADNSAFGGEQLGNVSNRNDLVTQWIGRPGPRYQTDRQNRKPSPLASGGRLYLQGQQRMITLDSYSGAVLWSLESPTVIRWNVPHDCANWCSDQKGLYVAAKNQAWYIDGRSGELAEKFGLPDHAQSGQDSWGYIARHQDLLLGTAVRPDAIYAKWWGPSQWFDSTDGPDTHLVAGDSFFALDHQSGDLIWSYDALILHATITILDDHVYFVEDKTRAHREGEVRRIALDAGQQHELVCLELSSGKPVWRKPVRAFAGHLASLYLAGGGDTSLRSLILSGSESSEKRFWIDRFDPSSGELVWSRDVEWEANHHGKHISRPAIQGELLYLRPEVINLADGATLRRGFPGGHGCSSYTLSANGLFSRLGETTWWDARNDRVHRFERIRTDCWLSVIPAQGMLLSAEGGGGCSCGSWLETSLGFLPRTIDEELPDQ